MANTKTEEQKGAARAAQVAGRVKAAKRRNDALGYLLAGASQRQAGEALGVSASVVNGDYRRAISEMVDANVVEEVRVLTMGRYNRLLMAWWTKAVGGIKDRVVIAPDPKAAGIVLQILQHVRQLHGLDPRLSVPGESPDHPLWTAALTQKEKEWLSGLSDREIRDLDDEVGVILDQHRDGEGPGGTA